MGPQGLLPKDKFDHEAIQRLSRRPPEELVLLLPELLEWTADINWPICRDAIELILTIPEHIIELIRKILQTTDEGWKCTCLDYVVPGLPLEQQQQRLRPELERIAYKPTQEETDEGTRGSAKEVLRLIETGANKTKWLTDD